MSLFLSLPGQIVFWSVAITYWILHGLAIINSRKTSQPLKTRSSSGFWALALAMLVGVLVVPLLGYTSRGLLPDWSYYLGIPIEIVGITLFFWGAKTLGRNYSPDVAIYETHQLVEEGPYRFVRHPIYIGIILIFVGAGFAVQSWIAVVFAVIVVGGATVNRVRAEEKLLIAEFGEQYISYSRRVKQLIPFIY